MKVLELLGINPTKGELVTLTGKTGHGRTSMLVKIACDLANEGKSVLFISDELAIHQIAEKCTPLLKIENPRFKAVRSDYPVEIITDYFAEEQDIDVVVLDGYFGNKTNFRVLAQKHDTLIINTIQMNKSGFVTGDTRPMMTSDCVISVTRINGSLTLLDKLKNFFLFWKPKKVAPNTQLALIKNRHGKQTKTDINFDFQSLQIKK